MARSTATLSDDGMMLSGKTTQLLVAEGDGKRKSATVDYEWVARKLAAPTKAADKEQNRSDTPEAGSHNIGR